MRTLKGRNTGVVRAAVEVFWNDMKRAHFIDAHTRVMTITMQLNSNHIGIRYRVTLMFELTSLGAVLPSYDMETRVEDEGRAKTQLIFMNMAMGLCGFFVLLEVRVRVRVRIDRDGVRVRLGLGLGLTLTLTLTRASRSSTAASPSTSQTCGTSWTGSTSPSSSSCGTRSARHPAPAPAPEPEL